jgi:hypothetical protein
MDGASRTAGAAMTAPVAFQHNGATTLAETDYAYDRAGKMNLVQNGSSVAVGYEYARNSSLISGIHYTNGVRFEPNYSTGWGR